MFMSHGRQEKEEDDARSQEKDDGEEEARAEAEEALSGEAEKESGREDQGEDQSKDQSQEAAPRRSSGPLRSEIQEGAPPRARPEHQRRRAHRRVQGEARRRRRG